MKSAIHLLALVALVVVLVVVPVLQFLAPTDCARAANSDEDMLPPDLACDDWIREAEDDVMGDCVIFVVLYCV